jgi:hypothetical protein
MGAFYNVPTGTLNYLGRDGSLLRPIINVPHITGYTHYVGFKNDWVWETGISFKYQGGSQPTTPTGIYVDSVYYPTGTNVGGVSYYIDYNQGAVVFDSPLAPSRIVQVPHALRGITIQPLDSYEYRTLDNVWQTYNPSASGINVTMQQLHLPAICVGLDGYSSKGMEIGSRNKYSQAKLRFEIFSSNPTELKKICDALYMLESKEIDFFDIKKCPKPLNYKGERVSGHVDYKWATQNYLLNKGLFKDGIKVIKIRDSMLPIYRARVFADLENIVNIVQ